MGDPTGNTAELLNNVFHANSDAINIFSSVIGTVADVAGGVGAVVGLISGITNLFTPQSDPLQPILNALQNDFSQLYTDLEARQNEDDWKQLAQGISAAESVMGILDGLVDANPPLTDDQRLSNIAICLTPLYALSDPTHPPSSFFLAPYSEQVYWGDAGIFTQSTWTIVGTSDPPEWGVDGSVDVGYGRRPPLVPADDQVFSYLYVLPYYLKAVLILATVGKALYANFGETQDLQQKALLTFANFLTTIHNLIVSGITELLPTSPPWFEPLNAGTPPSMIGIEGNFQAPTPREESPEEPTLEYIVAYWGAVEIYSGASSTRTGKISPDPRADFESSVYKKLAVRVLREKIATYAKVGLGDVSATISSLNSLAGQPPFPPQQYSGWSFREIFSEGGVDARSDGYFHLSDMAHLLRNYPPYDTAQQGTFSWRNLLEPG
jgi:hypothetical protein